MSDIGTRMKENYECPARHFLTRRMPVIIRVDGKAFHTLTRGLSRPFDQRFVNAMVSAAIRTAKEMQGFKLAFVQSDEASFLLTDYDGLSTDAWFGNNQSKIESVSASIMTAAFNWFLGGYCLRDDQLACFDARAFNIPESEVANYFLWRALDWERNSLSMYARKFFSQKQLHGKGRADIHEMLHKEGANWATDLPEQHRNGTWVSSAGDGFITSNDPGPTFSGINVLVEQSIDLNSDERN